MIEDIPDFGPVGIIFIKNDPVCSSFVEAVYKLEPDYPVFEVDAIKEKVAATNFKIKSLPTMILMLDGVEIKRTCVTDDLKNFFEYL
jgi:hypothetical protein